MMKHYKPLDLWIILISVILIFGGYKLLYANMKKQIIADVQEKVMEKVMEKTMNYIDRRVEKEMRSIESYTVLRMDMIEEKNKNKRNGGK